MEVSSIEEREYTIEELRRISGLLDGGRLEERREKVSSKKS